MWKVIGKKGEFPKRSAVTDKCHVPNILSTCCETKAHFGNKINGRKKNKGLFAAHFGYYGLNELCPA